MSNIYGFDFLRSEHTDAAARAGQSDGPPLRRTAAPTVTSPRVAAAPDAAHKTDLEKQFMVLRFLQTHRTSGCLPPSVIYKNTGVDLSGNSGADGGGGGKNASVSKMLIKNPKVRVEEIPDPEDPTVTILTYGYQAKFQNVRDRAGLLAQINRCKNGVGSRDLSDAYDGVEEDLAALVTAGDVLAVANPEDKDRILFPRGEQFLVELDGHVGLAKDVMEEAEKMIKEEEDKATSGGETPKKDGNGDTNKKDKNKDDIVKLAIQRAQADRRKKLLGERTCLLTVDVDPRKQIRRGEAVWVGGTWFRVSSAVREGVPLSEQPARAQAPPSVVLRRDLSRKNDAEGYIRPLTDRRLPIDRPLPKNAVRAVRDAKAARERLHGIAGGMRGVTGGAGAQLLSSNAAPSNPDALAAQFASVVAAAASGAHGHGGGGRRRPAASLAKQGGNAQEGAGAAGGSPDKQHMNPAPAAQRRAEAVTAAKAAAADPSLSYLHARRHGCTKDVRDMFLATAEDVPESEVELHQKMIEHKLVDPDEPMRRPRMKKKNPNLDSDGKPKKRRYYERKNQRMTNVHLIGTEIGQILAKASEKQQQGKSVGDGGM